ncbi:MAG TPA: hypothetical protein VGJ96_07300 [Gemmatimonadaceae bacterium]|jgi:hypothetical protein
MMHRRLVQLALPALLLAAAPAAAQRALGIGGDASTLPTGVLRIGTSALWDRANERYDASGKLRPLGASASAASWNGGYDASLAAAAPLVSALSGVAGFDPSLGALAIGRRDASTDAALSAEVGVMARLTIGAQLRVANHAIEPRIQLNAGRVEGSMGFNPAWANKSARDRNTALLTQFDSALAQTTRRIAQCQAGPTATGCAPIAANVAGAQTLVSNAAAFAAALNQLYGGRRNSAGLPFVPVANGAAQQAIDQRVQGYRDQFAALGITAIGTQGPVAAALFSHGNLATLLTDSLYGYRLRPLRAVHAYGLGEVSLHAKARVFDMLGADSAIIRGFAVRQSVGATVRLSGGSSPDADEPFAPVAGEGGSGFTLQSFTDLFYNQRFSASIVVGVDNAQAQEYAARIPSATAPSVGGVPFPLVPADREVQLTRTPGARLDISVTPRVALARNIWLGASWTFARQAADRWSTAALPASIAGAVESADVQAWASGTDWTEQRVALGGTYSTVAAAHEGHAKVAFDVSYEHQQTLTGNGWRVSHLSRDVVTVRWYPRIWGRR